MEVQGPSNPLQKGFKSCRLLQTTVITITLIITTIQVSSAEPGVRMWDNQEYELVILGCPTRAQRSNVGHPGITKTKVTSQCFRPNGISFVSLYCGIGKVVRVQEAFHGAHRHRLVSSACGHEEGDCQTVVTDLYDWTRCQSRHSCVQLVQQVASMPSCGGLRPTYLQVHYTCVAADSLLTGQATSSMPLPPVSSQSNVSPPTNPERTARPVVAHTTPEMDTKAANICLNKTVHMSELYIQSPGYPQFYPGGLDCRCEIRASALNSITVGFEKVKLAPDLSEENTVEENEKDKLCDDWLMLEAPQYKGAGVVVCRDVMAPGRKSLQSRSSHIVLHLHTQVSLGVRHLKGFRVRITGSGDEELEIDCYQTSAEIALRSIPPGSASDDPARPYALPPTNFGSSASVSGAAHTTAHQPTATLTCLGVLLIVLLGISA